MAAASPSVLAVSIPFPRNAVSSGRPRALEFQKRSFAVRCSGAVTGAGQAEPRVPAVSPVERRTAMMAPLVAAAAAAALPLAGAAQGAELGVCELQSSPSGLLFCDTLLGSGFQPEAGSLIKAHYTGRLLNGSVFDSSYNRGRPLAFRVGVGEVIRGWDLGILGGEGIPPMQAGGKRTLRIPAELAYGTRGAGCRGGSCAIPPNSDLIFEVELVGKA